MLSLERPFGAPQLAPAVDWSEGLVLCPARGFWSDLAAGLAHPAAAALVLAAGYVLGALAVYLAIRLVERRAAPLPEQSPPGRWGGVRSFVRKE